VFFSWQEASGGIAYNPMSGLKFRRGERNSREALSLDEIAALFSAALSIRERVMLHLFYSCGLRRSEAVKPEHPRCTGQAPVIVYAFW
jgi:integrase/recombinase XerD